MILDKYFYGIYIYFLGFLQIIILFDILLLFSFLSIWRNCLFTGTFLLVNFYRESKIYY